MKKVFQLLLINCVLLLSSWSSAESDLAIEITKGIDEPTPVAVVPFAWDGNSALKEDVAKIVSADLGRTGLFKMMSPQNMLSFPSKEDQVYFRDWRVSKTEFLIIGRQIAAEGRQIKVEFELYDVLKEQRLLLERVSGTQDNLRDVAHYISDMIYQKLTGIRGAFSTRIVYVTAKQLGQGKVNYRLKMADSDGARPVTIRQQSEPLMSPAWSRDGTKLAYVSFESGKPAIYIQYLATGKREKVQSFRGLNGAPSWSPSGNKLAIVLSKDGNPEIYVLDLNSRSLSRITHHYGIDTEPSWSPDGQSLIFTSDRGGQPQIYRIHLPTRQLERVTFEGNYNSRGRLTHDGRFLAMVHRGIDNVFHIAVQDLKTGRLDVLTDTYLDESPTIAPNGSIILYATQKGVKGVLGGVTLDGNVRFILPASSGDVREPAWSPYLQ
ncbi:MULTISPECIES: Tol-Pal system beta propeller repeat protein TolB [unclassified Neptuniibacter]|uniref:Tol-Pal system beta propeller repeat protein TolB n=1 Tax=unclassified Neptuniibacter TaxID=2630693 RepID=UPI000C5A61F4|nr:MULTISPECIES: Tol-Pal system beta propeller repeat protein TolB [unclassified Neptuniibacter]MAY42101.1 Tol-Pal system beta propeller repeat protein TolB [Oceanospirillaceae bacterium]